MTIQATDRLLVNRWRTSYYVEYGDIAAKVRSGDVVLVNRNGVSHKISACRLLTNGFNDSDLFLVNRGGQSFKCPGSELKLNALFRKPTFKKAEWTFLQKTSSYSEFRFIMEWDNFNCIYTI